MCEVKLGPKMVSFKKKGIIICADAFKHLNLYESLPGCEHLHCTREENLELHCKIEILPEEIVKKDSNESHCNKCSVIIKWL